MQAGAIQGLAVQAEAGVEQLGRALPVGHVHAEAFAHRAEAHAVLQLARQKGRNVEGLVHADLVAPVTICRQHVVITLAPWRVADFAEDGHQALCGVVTVEDAHRVEGQAPAARLRQYADATLRARAQCLLYPIAHGLVQRHALAGGLGQVVGFTEGEWREAAGAGQLGEGEQLRLFAQVEVQQAHAIAKGMGARGEAAMLHPAAVQGAVHHSASPKARATRSALITPSS